MAMPLKWDKSGSPRKVAGKKGSGGKYGTEEEWAERDRQEPQLG